MVKTIYKTLFEVKFLHEFYLTDKEGTTVFDLVNQTDRIGFLFNRFEEGLSSIDNDILFEIPDFLEVDFQRYHLHLLNTYSGFEILSEVKEKVMPDGSTRYESLTKLPDAYNLFVLISKKTNTLNFVSNSRIKNAIPFRYYFSNEDLATSKTFPFLSNDISAFDLTNIYEQGELASFGSNDIRQFYRSNNTDKWNPVSGTGYANENDRLVVPWEFNYSFDVAENITDAKFELRDTNGNVIRTYEFKDANPLQNISLNFRNDKVSLPPLIAILTGTIYSLNVTVNNTRTILNKVIFFESDSVNDYWGVVSIKPKVTNAAFNLYASDGTIVLSKSSAGQVSAAPVFEIRVKSRLTYWRYINDKKGNLKLSPETTDLLDSVGNNLVSKTPKTASYLTTFFKNDLDNKFYYLPNPVTYDMISSEDRQFYTDIPIPESKMFPVI